MKETSCVLLYKGDNKKGYERKLDSHCSCMFQIFRLR